MNNFGFARLRIVKAFQPHWREARSAVGSAKLLLEAEELPTLHEAVSDCTLVLGTGTTAHRRPMQPVVRLDKAAPLISDALEAGGIIAIVFGSEKHGLTRYDLSSCHALIEIPTFADQPSMNLGQAAAVCLYELAVHVQPEQHGREDSSGGFGPDHQRRPATSGEVDILANLVEQVMIAADYSPLNMRVANRRDLRLMLRRLRIASTDLRRLLGLFRRILWRLTYPKRNVT